MDDFECTKNLNNLWGYFLKGATKILIFIVHVWNFECSKKWSMFKL